MTLNKGDMLSQRYEIVEKIGVGGMSVVYLAKDTKLGRDVAVKILREELAADEDIRARFGDEAKSAASLIHPNIVNVYDVGEDKGCDYIVMEYIEGKTLKDLIKEKAPFNSITTISVALQVANALSYAHKNKIIHKDIKPQNIMIAKNGNVKVMDFGIARAANISTLTNVVSAVGSVHYLSPEQARGGFVDNKSDIYSLGITMYEMVTGKIPFSGENSVSIALKHINDDLPDMREYNPSMNKSLESIIRKAANKKVDERYADIDLMAEDLKLALTEVSDEFIARKNAEYTDESGAKAPEGPSSNFYNIDMSEKDNEIPAEGGRDVRVWFDSDNTAENTMQEAATDAKKAFAEEAAKVEAEAEAAKLADSADPSAGAEGGQPNIPPATVGFDMYSKKLKIDPENPEYASVRKHFKKVKKEMQNVDYDEEFAQEEEAYTKKEERKVIAAAIITAIVIVAVIAFIGVKYFMGENSPLSGFKLPFNLPFTSSQEKEEVPEEPEETGVPVLIGKNYDEAVREAQGKGYTIIRAGDDYNDTFAEGQIISQDAKAGSEITDRMVINVIVSKGPAVFQMPNVVGMPEADAEKGIMSLAQSSGANNVSVNLEYVFSPDVEMGKVMEQSPAEGENVSNNTPVTLTVSKGEESATVAVPAVEGKLLADAEKTLLGMGLVVGDVTLVESDTYAEGYVITQTVAEGEEVAKNSAVDLIVSQGSSAKEQAPESNAVIYTVDKPIGLDENEMVKIKLYKVDASGETTTLIDTERKVADFPFDVQLQGEGQAEIQLYINDEYQWSRNVSF
ncbi:MAG: protein kinase [Firmicutes bacterium]|nr:protein kinase [Bacillota bacterium]